MNLTRSQAEHITRIVECQNQIVQRILQIKEHHRQLDEELQTIQQTCTHPWPITEKIDGWWSYHCPDCDHHWRRGIQT